LAALFAPSLVSPLRSSQTLFPASVSLAYFGKQASKTMLPFSLLLRLVSCRLLTRSHLPRSTAPHSCECGTAPQKQLASNHRCNLLAHQVVKDQRTSSARYRAIPVQLSGGTHQVPPSGPLSSLSTVGADRVLCRP